VLALWNIRKYQSNFTYVQATFHEYNLQFVRSLKGCFDPRSLPWWIGIPLKFHLGFCFAIADPSVYSTQ
jgi:hypothetical protein